MRGNQNTRTAKTAKTVGAHGALSLTLMLCLASSAFAISRPVTTSLVVSPATSVAAQTPVTFVATVSSFGSQRNSGLVSFCDLNVGCADQNLLGKAWLTRSGNATLKVVLPAGSYNVVAIYNGAESVPSSPQFVNVAGASTYASGLSISGTGKPGHYTFTAKLSAFGKAAPTGVLSFVDASSSNSVLASANVQSTAAQIAFAASPTAGPTTGKGSYAIAAGDFNNDGYSDVAVVNSGDSTVSIALGKGNGAFSTPAVYHTGLAPVSVAVGDFDGDGFQDLAIANSADSTVGVLLGKGDGTFKTQVSYALSSAPSSVTVADVNLDGIADIVVANNLGNCVSVLLGLGDGTFASPATYATGARPAQVVVTDVNADGVPDILTANATDNTISILFGDGSGAFGSSTSYATGSEPHSIAAGDLNGDGYADLVIANYGDNSISILMNNGDGTFQPQSKVKVGTNPYQVVMGDFNQDGNVDVAVANAMSNTVSVLLGAGNGSFRTPVSYSVGTMPTALVSADFNADGLPDLAITSFGAGHTSNLSVLLGQQFLQATISVDVIGNGSQQILAKYAGDALHAPSISQALIAKGLAIPTSIQVKSSPNPAVRGARVSFTAIVASTSGKPTGSVTFFDGKTKLGAVTLSSSGTALYTLTTLSVGNHSITAMYSGDARYASSTSASLTETVQLPPAPAKTKTLRF